MSFFLNIKKTWQIKKLKLCELIWQETLNQKELLLTFFQTHIEGWCILCIKESLQSPFGQLSHLCAALQDAPRFQ